MSGDRADSYVVSIEELRPFEWRWMVYMHASDSSEGILPVDFGTRATRASATKAAEKALRVVLEPPPDGKLTAEVMPAKEFLLRRNAKHRAEMG